MALIYNTVLRPSKLEVIASWLPGQEWFRGDVDQLAAVAAYRFDDPDGEVGMEGHLISAGDDTIYHVPLTYRGAELAGADAHLLGTVEHGVLGKRWFYDAEQDPVYRAVLRNTIVTGGREAAEFETDDPAVEPIPKAITTQVWGMGSAGSALGATAPDPGTLTVARALDKDADPETNWVLRGIWPGAAGPTVLAALS